MKSVLRTVGLLAALALTGCLDMAMNINVDAKRGTTASLSIQMFDQIYQAMHMQAAAGNNAFAALEDESLLRSSLAKIGGKLRRYRNEVKEGLREIEIVVHIEDLKQLEGQLDNEFVRFVSREDGAWSFTLDTHEIGLAFQNMDKAVLEQQIRNLAPNISGLKWRIDVTVPELVESNLQKKAANQVVYDLDFDRDIATQESKQAVDSFLFLVGPKYVVFKGI